MSNLPHGKQGQTAETPKRSPLRNAIVQSAITLLTVISATAISAGLIQGLQIGRVATILLAAVLIVAVVFGLVYGLLAAVAAAIAFSALTGLPVLPADLVSEQGFLLTLYAGFVIITGAYTDLVRRRTRAANTLLEAAKPLSTHVSGPALGEFLDRAAPSPDAKATSASFMEEVQGVLVCFSIVAAGWASMLVLGDARNPANAVLVLLGSVLLVGGILGARFGLAAGALATLARTAFPLAIGAPAPLEIAFDLVAFAVMGWGVGKLSDALRQERRAVHALVAASRDMSVSNDEGQIRQALLDSLVKITGGGDVVLSDEAGAPPLISPGAPTPNPGDARWRQRPLASEGRNVGVAHWRHARSEQHSQTGDEIAASLIDLGASAIARTRLSLEKSEMELVARTEHLRTILLDAVSHHFRSPLAGILGSATSILNLPEPHDRGTRRELLLIIKEQANRLNRYVENFLSVARLESGSIDMKISEFSIEPLIYDVWEMFGEAGGARRFLHVKLDGDLVRADPNLLTQVFGNVLENAIKYSAEGSLVDVRSRKLGDRLVIDVTDQGCGIPPASENKIFDRFYRSTGSSAPGLGLGLYITRSLVSLLGGSVEAHNRKDGEQGLVVSVALPLAEAAA